MTSRGGKPPTDLQRLKQGVSFLAAWNASIMLSRRIWFARFIPMARHTLYVLNGKVHPKEVGHSIG
jgi:hypothetical protein